MRTIAILLIMVGVIVADAARRDRVKELGKDLSDAFQALITQDADALGEVLTRTGEEDVSAAVWANTTGIKVGETLTDVASKVGSKSLASETVRLGQAAKGYRWTATGPTDYFDCSGLVWRACKNTGLYNGPRFTTATIQFVSAFERVSTPAVGDIVVWPTHHMGVVTGPDQFYSARNRATGIGYGKISTWAKTKPVYYRPKGKSRA